MRLGSLWLLLVVLTVAVIGVSGTTVWGQENAPSTAPVAKTQLANNERVLLTPGMEEVFWHGMKIVRCAYWMIVVSHIVLAVWVGLDIRQRKAGSLLFVLLALLGGFLGAAVYALVRIGDKKG